MSRTAAERARVRLALVLVVSCALAVLVPSLAMTAGESSSAVMLAAVTLAFASGMSLASYVVSLARVALASPPCVAPKAPPLLSGRVTDTVHHPLRPRAPGLA